MNDQKRTPGPYTRLSAAIVGKCPKTGKCREKCEHETYYGGHLIAESIFNEADLEFLLKALNSNE